MDANWTIITIVAICGLILIVLVVLKDQKAKRELIKSINEEADSKTTQDREKEAE